AVGANVVVQFVLMAPAVVGQTVLNATVTVSTSSGQVSTVNNTAAQALLLSAAGGPPGAAFNSIAIGPGIVYAGTSGGGVFKSADGAQTWTPINAGLTGPFVNAVVVDPSTPATVYAVGFGNVLKSTNSGESWSFLTSGIPNINIWSLAVDP